MNKIERDLAKIDKYGARLQEETRPLSSIPKKMCGQWGRYTFKGESYYYFISETYIIRHGETNGEREIWELGKGMTVSANSKYTYLMLEGVGEDNNRSQSTLCYQIKDGREAVSCWTTAYDSNGQYKADEQIWIYRI